MTGPAASSTLQQASSTFRQRALPANSQAAPDEYSLWGAIPDEGIGPGELLLHHTSRPLSGECPCPDGQGAELCAHMAALAWTFLGDDAELAAVSRDELVRLALDLADGSAWARQMIWSQLAG